MPKILTLRDYVADLTTAELWAICDSYEEFEKQGWCGDTPVRVYAEIHLATLGIRSSILIHMQLLAYECYRKLARSQWTDT